MGLNSTDRVLELGCGPGWFSRQIAESIPQGELVLCDIQEDMLEIAKKRTEPLVNVRTQVSSAASLPFDVGNFDVVFLSSVLGEIPEKRACISEIRRVLKGGGSVVVVETRRDSDFIRFDDLLALAESSGFSLDRRWGSRWEYTVRLNAV